ncbi:PIN domain-containing protein [Xenorhabdus lircayensis]|uniref:PIN domain-containing protein n=1 Tax=Xenorhabdus lircayensis TaxID=2763499 RepID=UPI001E28CDF3|nr:PIN domain-containing protein [Xenorhabdus lircayensis]
MKYSPYPVVLDACVLYPARLRDLLMHLGLAGLYQPKWSDAIQDEWKRNLLQQRPDIPSDRLEHTTVLMNKGLARCQCHGF